MKNFFKKYETRKEEKMKKNIWKNYFRSNSKSKDSGGYDYKIVISKDGHLLVK